MYNEAEKQRKQSLGLIIVFSLDNKVLFFLNQQCRPIGVSTGNNSDEKRQWIKR